MTDPFVTRVPPAAADYCRQLWEQYRFQFRLVRPRQTRLGDFRAYPDGRIQITVNVDLHPYAFLITYIHEVAHLVVYRQQRRRVKPHGTAWQTAFQQLMQPLLTETVFPVDVLLPLRAYLTKPAASTFSCPALMRALRPYEPAPVPAGLPGTPAPEVLCNLSEGQSFTFRDKIYVRGALRRTRVLCREKQSGRAYAILAHALVVAIDRDF